VSVPPPAAARLGSAGRLVGAWRAPPGPAKRAGRAAADGRAACEAEARERQTDRETRTGRETDRERRAQRETGGRQALDTLDADDAAGRAEAAAAAGVVRRLWADAAAHGMDAQAAAEAAGATYDDAARLKRRLAGRVPEGAAALYRDLRYLAGLKREMEAAGGGWADPVGYGLDPLYDRLDFRLIPPDTDEQDPRDAGGSAAAADRAWRVTYVGASRLQARA
jgi:hypothetical protein